MLTTRTAARLGARPRSGARSRLVAPVLVVAIALLAACAPTPSSVRGSKGPLPVVFNAGPMLLQVARDSTARPPGANDFTCRPSERHPRPVVLVHGLIITQAYWQTLSPLLANNGYCVFTLTYGSNPGLPTLGGLRPIGESSHELAAFVDRVLAATGAAQVDLVGHSEGTLMPQYYLKRLGGAPKVHAFVALNPVYDGSDLLGADRLVAALLGLPLGIGLAIQQFITVLCGACIEVLHGSAFLRDLFGDGVIAVPGVRYTTILSRLDEIVTPYTSGYIDDPAVTNIVLQDGCEQDTAEHVATPMSPRALGFVLNALDPAHAEPPPCVATDGAWGVRT